MLYLVVYITRHQFHLVLGTKPGLALLIYDRSYMIDPKAIKSEFPIFQSNKNLVYLDNAATSQRPRQVIETIIRFYSEGNANIHRGLYRLSTDATMAYESIREIVSQFLNAGDPNSIAFTKGTTESINMVARGFALPLLNKGDNIVISVLEHHANLLPWQQICQEKKAILRVLPIDKEGNVDYDKLSSILDDKTTMVAITHISNTLGTVVDLQKVIEKAHQHDIPVLVDGAQSVATHHIDIQDLGCDFFAFSGHKMFGPFGVGILYAHPKHHDKMNPYNVGGGMITNVTFEKADFKDYPFNMEAGTAAIAEVIGLGEAIKFINTFDRKAMIVYLKELGEYCRKGLRTIPGLKLIGRPDKVAGIISFTMDGIHPHDIATFLAEDNIAVRAGHHCTQPLLEFLGVGATVRVSLSIYNQKDDIDFLINSLMKIKNFWS